MSDAHFARQAEPYRAPTRSLAAMRVRLWADVAILAGALGVFAWLAAQMAPFTPDDSYISFRYAQHLADGAGLRFNVAEPPLEAYSNFLWVALLAGSARLGLSLEAAGLAWGLLFGALNVATLWALLRRRGHTGLYLALPMLLLALAAPLVLYAVSGLETALFAWLLTALVLCLDCLLARPSPGRGLALGGVGVLAALARPEGALALPIVVVCALVLDGRAAPDRRALARALLAGGLLFVVALGVYHAARVAYFGAAWPTPFLSKGVVERSLLDTWLVNLRQFFVRQSNYYSPLAYYYLALGLPAVAGVVLAVGRGRRTTEWSALALAVAFAVVYLNFVDWMPGLRYHAPLVALLLTPLALLGPELRHEARGRRTDAAYALLGATLVFVSLFALSVLRLDSQALNTGTQDALVALGRWLRQATPAGSTLAMSDVGATPYYSGLPTFDINPQSLTDRTIAANGWSADYFFQVDPDIVILTAFSLTRPDFYSQHEALYATPQFQETYELIGVVPNDWYEDRSYWVFMRRGQTPPAAMMATFPPGISKR